MNTMMGRCHHYLFKPSPLTQCLRTYKERIQSMNDQERCYHDSWKSNERQYRPKHAPDCSLEYSNAGRYRIIKVFTLVMHHMGSPQRIHLMSETVIPIPNKIGCKKQKYPGKNICFDMENSKMLIDII